MNEREMFGDWKNQSNSINPWLAWEERARIDEQQNVDLEESHG